MPLVLVPALIVALPEAWRIESGSGSAANRWWLYTAVLVGLSGLALRAAAVAFAPDGTSSRDTHQLRASSLTTTGVYSAVRNPLYLGNALMWLGAVASLRVWWLVVITAGVYWLYIERVILVEEAFLERTFGAAFLDWARRTPAFLPRWSEWRRPEGAFSWRRLANEHNGLLGLVATVTVLQAATSIAVGGRSWRDFRAERADLLILLAGSLVLSLAVVAVKRASRRPSRSATATAA